MVQRIGKVLQAVYVMIGVFVLSVLWAVVWLADNRSYGRRSIRC